MREVWTLSTCSRGCLNTVVCNYYFLFTRTLNSGPFSPSKIPQPSLLFHKQSLKSGIARRVVVRARPRQGSSNRVNWSNAPGKPPQITWNWAWASHTLHNSSPGWKVTTHLFFLQLNLGTTPAATWTPTKSGHAGEEITTGAAFENGIIARDTL